MSTQVRDPFSCFVLQCGRAAAPVPVLEPQPLSCVSSPCSLAPGGAMGTQLYLHDFELLCLLSPTEPLVPPAPFQAALSLSLSMFL